MAKTCPGCGYQPIGPYTDNCPICGEVVRGRGAVVGRGSGGPGWSSTMPIWLRWVIAGGVAAVLGVGGCCGVGAWQVNRAARDFQQEMEQERAQMEAERKARTVAVPAADLLREFAADPKAADRRYRGKCLEVSGVVERVGTDGDDFPFAVVHAGDPAAPIKLECFFDFFEEDADEARVKKLKPGQAVTVRGEYDGRVSHVRLRECRLVK